MSLILASQSVARQNMLRGAGLSFETYPADIDEAIHKNTDASPQDIARKLAEEKALAVSQKFPNALIIGSDQILEFQGKLLTKAKNQEEARTKLEMLRGKTHHLYSAVAVVQNGKVLWGDVQGAFLTMHNFSDLFLQAYLKKAGEALTRSVGAYELESLGAQLFESIEGDYFTILGMPLLSLLTYLREEHGEHLKEGAA